MKFKEFRDLIFSPCYVVLGNVRCFVETHEQTDFDDYEVEGVRANTFDEFDECIIVDLCERKIDTDSNYNSTFNKVYGIINDSVQAKRCSK